jgi:hypothetical protein
MAPTKVNFKIYQGSTFNEVLRWESATKKYVPITAMFKAAPLVITAVAHGMPVGWRGIISNAGGMTEANSLGYIVATNVTTDNITFNSVNAEGFKTYTSGGIFEYNEPNSLTGYTARMQIREKLTSTTMVDELTTENGKITISDVTKTITLNLTALETAAYTFKTAVYSLELVNGLIVTPFIYGDITLVTEITR